MKFWASGDSLDAKPTDISLMRKWQELSPIRKHTNVKLNGIDQKIYSAIRIEEVFAANEIMIGINGPNTDNIVVVPFAQGIVMTLASTLLSHKIATLSLADDMDTMTN